MAEYYKGKFLDMGLAEEFGLELEFDTELMKPYQERKFCLIPNNQNQLHGAKLTMLNSYQKPNIVVPSNLGVNI